MKTSYLLEKKDTPGVPDTVETRIAAAKAALVDEYKDKPEVVRLKDGEGIWVEAHRSDWNEIRTATGASLSQLLRKIKADDDFLIITAFRPSEEVEGTRVPRTMRRNFDQFRAVPKELRGILSTKRIGAYWLVGHWTNCSVPLEGNPISECSALGGELIDSLEYSWFFVKGDKDVTSEAFLDAAIKIASAHEQEAFVIRLDGITTLRNGNGSVVRELSSTGAIEQAWATLAEKRGQDQPYGYSEVRNIRERGRRQPIAFPDAAKPGDAPKPKTSSYRVRGNGKAYAPAFFVAKPSSNSSHMIFAAMGVSFIV